MEAGRSHCPWCWGAGDALGGTLGKSRLAEGRGLWRSQGNCSSGYGIIEGGSCKVLESPGPIFLFYKWGWGWRPCGICHVLAISASQVQSLCPSVGGRAWYLGLNPSFATTSSATLGRLFNASGPWVSHVLSRRNAKHRAELWRGLTALCVHDPVQIEAPCLPLSPLPCLTPVSGQ